MRNLDWQMILFVGTSLAQDYWMYWRLPRIYYWDTEHDNLKKLDKKDEKKVA